ncbi:MAG: TetR/AcrR family transcriptional regulator [Opitutales bacterium]
MQNAPTTGRPLEFDPEKTRAEIMRLFWEKGFTAVSLPELEARTGLSRSSLYNSFGSKQEIFGQALERYRREVGEQMCRPLEAGTRGLADLLEFFDAAARQFSSPAGAAGCLLVNSMVEFGGADEAVAGHVSEHLARLRRALAGTLERAAKLGEVPSGHAEEKANLVLGLLLGITVSARAGLPRAEVGAMVEAARTQIRGWSVKPARRHRLVTRPWRNLTFPSLPRRKYQAF